MHVKIPLSSNQAGLPAWPGGTARGLPRRRSRVRAPEPRHLQLSLDLSLPDRITPDQVPLNKQKKKNFNIVNFRTRLWSLSSSLLCRIINTNGFLAYETHSNQCFFSFLFLDWHLFHRWKANRGLELSHNSRTRKISDHLHICILWVDICSGNVAITTWLWKTEMYRPPFAAEDRCWKTMFAGMIREDWMICDATYTPRLSAAPVYLPTYVRVKPSLWWRAPHL